MDSGRPTKRKKHWALSVGNRSARRRAGEQVRVCCILYANALRTACALRAVSTSARSEHLCALCAPVTVLCVSEHAIGRCLSLSFWVSVGGDCWRRVCLCLFECILASGHGAAAQLGEQFSSGKAARALGGGGGGHGPRRMTRTISKCLGGPDSGRRIARSEKRLVCRRAERRCCWRLNGQGSAELAQLAAEWPSARRTVGEQPSSRAAEKQGSRAARRDGQSPGKTREGQGWVRISIGNGFEMEAGRTQRGPSGPGGRRGGGQGRAPHSLGQRHGRRTQSAVGRRSRGPQFAVRSSVQRQSVCALAAHTVAGRGERETISFGRRLHNVAVVVPRLRSATDVRRSGRIGRIGRVGRIGRRVLAATLADCQLSALAAGCPPPVARRRPAACGLTAQRSALLSSVAAAAATADQVERAASRVVVGRRAHTQDYRIAFASV